MIKYLDELDLKDLQGKRVLLRLDLNAPVVHGQLTDTNRLERVIETIDFLRGKKARTLIISHCAGSETTSLVPAWHYLNGYFPVEFSPTYFTPEAIDKVLKLEEKGVLLFENIRTNPGEQENNQEFAKKLSQMADIYVNDAFGESHREYASIVSVPEYIPHYEGLLMKQEVENLSKAFNPKHPFVFILGGAKFETKIPLIKKYLEKADTVFVGGALANDIYKEKGFEIGTSRISKGEFGLKDIINNPKLIVPVDVTVTKDDGSVSFKKPTEILKDECIVDAGPETIEQLKKILIGSKTIVWNGPLGNYEKGYKDKTESLAELIVEATNNGAESIIGGGDTVASINSLGINDKFSFVSTGGGAMLDYLATETLVGLEALNN